MSEAENSVKNAGTGGNWPLSAAEAAPPLLHLADSRAGNNGERTRGGVATGQGVRGEGNPQNLLTLVNC